MRILWEEINVTALCRQAVRGAGHGLRRSLTRGGALLLRLVAAGRPRGSGRVRKRDVATTTTPKLPSLRLRGLLPKVLAGVAVIGVVAAGVLTWKISQVAPTANASFGTRAAAYFGDTAAYAALAKASPDKQEALAWYAKLAETGDAAAQDMLAHTYFYGDGVPRDKASALYWYAKAAERGDAEAQFRMGEAYDFGIAGKAEDKAQAAQWYAKAAAQGHDKAQELLANAYMLGRGVEKNPQEAARWYGELFKKWLADAEKGNAAAQYRVAEAYELGMGTDKNEAEAVRWYKLSAGQGNGDAQQKLGLIYDYGGDAVDFNAELADKWLAAAFRTYQTAAGRGDRDAQGKLVAAYRFGYGTKRDEGMATALLTQYVSWGNAQAQYELGYELKGSDAAAALTWFEQAAGRDHAAAQYELGLAYQNGAGTAVDAAAAEKWLRMALNNLDPRISSLAAKALGESAWRVLPAAQAGAK